MKPNYGTRMLHFSKWGGVDGAYNSFNFLNIPSINILFKQHEIERTGWDKKINFDTLTDSKTNLYQRN